MAQDRRFGARDPAAVGVAMRVRREAHGIPAAHAPADQQRAQPGHGKARPRKDCQQQNSWPRAWLRASLQRRRQARSPRTDRRKYVA